MEVSNTALIGETFYVFWGPLMESKLMQCFYLTNITNRTFFHNNFASIEFWARPCFSNLNLHEYIIYY